jgi:hypothetical protein
MILYVFIRLSCSGTVSHHSNEFSPLFEKDYSFEIAAGFTILDIGRPIVLGSLGNYHNSFGTGIVFFSIFL